MKIKDQHTDLVEMEQAFRVPVATLWKALTTHRYMVQWFFENIPAFEAKKGFKTRFVVTSGGRNFTHCWEILEVVPEKKIVYDWSYLEYEGRSELTFFLEGDATGSRLKLAHSGLNSFTAKVPEFSRESCQQGWAFFIGERLPAFLKAGK